MSCFQHSEPKKKNNPTSVSVSTQAICSICASEEHRQVYFGKVESDPFVGNQSSYRSVCGAFDERVGKMMENRKNCK